MKSTTSKLVKGLGIGLAAGGAAAAIGASMMSPGVRRQTRKNTVRMMKTVGNLMEGVNSMIK